MSGAHLLLDSVQEKARDRTKDMSVIANMGCSEQSADTRLAKEEESVTLDSKL